MFEILRLRSVPLKLIQNTSNGCKISVHQYERFTFLVVLTKQSGELGLEEGLFFLLSPKLDQPLGSLYIFSFKPRFLLLRSPNFTLLLFPIFFSGITPRTKANTRWPFPFRFSLIIYSAEKDLKYVYILSRSALPRC